ncbi:chemotaxis protein CheW [Massilia sp. DD77]|uniref:chemotaxis protein CheW n=1 Tax=Massilia sp. DD77 TaxID=3109349 RepID=UPI0030003B70
MHSASTTPQEFLSFTLGGLEYGLDCAKVQELKPLKSLERFAADGEIIGGVALSRGVILPVVDLRAAFAPGVAAPHPDTEVMIVRLASCLAGLVVEEVGDVVRLSTAQIVALPGAHHADYLIGMGVSQQRRLVLVDIDRLMSLAPKQPKRAA